MARKSNCLTLQNSLTEEDMGEGAGLSNAGKYAICKTKVKKCMCAGSSSSFPQGYGMLAKSLQSCLDSVILWTVAHQAPLSMGFARQEYWGGLPCPPPGDLATQGLNSGLLLCRWILYAGKCRRPTFDSWVRKIPWKRDRLPTPVFLGFPCGSDGKEAACNVGDLGLTRLSDFHFLHIQ